MARALVKEIKDNKNYLINGGFNFWQRNSTGPGSGTTEDTTLGYKSTDRWRHRYDALGGSITSPTYRKGTDVPFTAASGSSGPYSFMWAFQRNAGAAFVGHLAQRVESVHARELFYNNPNQKVSISVYYKTDVATSLTLLFETPTATDNYASTNILVNSTITIIADNTWRIAKFENIDVSTATNLINGVQVKFLFTTPNAGGADGAGKVILVSLAQLNKGAVAESFKMFAANVSDELSAYQRYYEKSYEHNINPGSITNNGTMTSHSNSTGAINKHPTIFYKVVKRVTITPTFYNPNSGATGTWREQTPADRTVTILTNADSNFAVVISSVGAGQLVFGHWVADAEL